jgi:D-alanyl-D-alanine carboxypeptidase (penicillin-binding protein 5/6)
MTKVLTLIVAVENMETTDQACTITEEMYNIQFTRDASCAGFLPGELVSMYDLLYGLILPSGADAALRFR